MLSLVGKWCHFPSVQSSLVTIEKKQIPGRRDGSQKNAANKVTDREFQGFELKRRHIGQGIALEGANIEPVTAVFQENFYGSLAHYR